MRSTILILFLLIFTGCSFKTTPQDMWRKNAATAFERYSDYYLKGETALASASLNSAIKNAKSSADLRPLSKIYLGTCALHIAVLIDDPCSEYKAIRDMLDPEHSSWDYYNMLQKNFDNITIKNLPPQYGDFVTAMQKEDFQGAFQSIQKMPKTSSLLIAASLMRKHLNESQIHEIINAASFRGYKKAVVRWLGFLKEKSSGIKKQKIDKMLDLLTH
ncbi:hypothetical protein [Sulfurospirillum sp. 1612]|uniref:hypothetical protein n=1 Tax=Sulfurospirillum sp. 1612 TaxID=3094835 RepID=UPI002F928323